MSDEFQQRYEHLSHSDLYSQLMAGDPEQIEGLASDWSSLETTVSDLAHSLRSDLDKLEAGWRSASGTEYSRRIGLIRSYADQLATEFNKVQQGLALMAGPLRNAQKQAESPDEVDDNDKAITGAVIGGAVAGPVGAAVGGFFGHQKDEEEQEKARQRMVKLVAGLAAVYDESDHARWPKSVPVPPPDMPGHPTGGPTTPTGGPQVSTPAAGPGTGTTTTPVRSDVPQPHTASDLPSTNPGHPVYDSGTAAPTEGLYSTLAGADGGLSSTVLGGWAAGAGGVALAAGAAARSGSKTGSGLNPNQLPTGAVLGASAGMSPGASATPEPAKAATGAGRGITPRGSDVLGRTSDSGRAAAAGGHRGHQEDEGDEHRTWLTEDEMVWDADQKSAPSVLDNNAV